MLNFIRSVREDIGAVMERDPAARSWLEIVTCYPGLHALWAHRVNHWLWNRKLRTTTRSLPSGTIPHWHRDPSRGPDRAATVH